MNARFLVRLAILLIISLSYSTQLKAQVQMSYTMDSPDFVLASLNPNKYSVLDSAYLTLTYHFQTKASENDTQLSIEDDMVLLIGKRYTSFFSKNLRENDILNDSLVRTAGYFEPNDIGWQGYEIRQNLSKKEVIVDNRIPFTTEVYRYEEKVPMMAWHIQNETDSIMGYNCQKATLHYAGREYIAWFTSEIPVGFGPWKFQGLPGAILKITDTKNNFMFECIGLSQQARPILDYNWKYKNTTKKEWLKFEKYMYEQAGRFIKNLGVSVLIIDNSEKGSHSVPESWSAYYNPMEF